MSSIIHFSCISMSFWNLQLSLVESALPTTNVCLMSIWSLIFLFTNSDGKKFHDCGQLLLEERG